MRARSLPVLTALCALLLVACTSTSAAPPRTPLMCAFMLDLAGRGD